MFARILRRSVNFIPYSIRTRIRDIPIARSLQRWVFRSWLSGQSFDYTINAGPAKGLRYPIELPQDKNIWTGTYEPEFAAEVVSRITPGAVCYDIGGFRGFFSGVMACRGASEVFVFEPFPSNCNQISRMTALNPDLRIELVRSAVADTNGNVAFEVMPEASMGKLSESRFDSGGADAAETITVPQLCLDDFIFEQNKPAPDLLKIDVEGAEASVLRGAQRMLKEHNPVLLIEVHSPSIGQECLPLLEDCGYDVTILQTGRRPEPETHPEVCHYVAVRNPGEQG